jgi:hypothetical protein
MTISINSNLFFPRSVTTLISWLTLCGDDITPKCFMLSHIDVTGGRKLQRTKMSHHVRMIFMAVTESYLL